MEKKVEILNITYPLFLLLHFLPAYTKYLEQMQKRGRIREDVNPEQIALNFIWLNIGQFWTSRFWENEQHQLSNERFYELSIRPFVHLLTT